MKTTDSTLRQEARDLDRAEPESLEERLELLHKEARKLGDYPYELPLGLLESTKEASEVKELVDSLWESLPEDHDLRGDLFGVARGLYWYCTNYHWGQNSERYKVLSSLDYSPGANEYGPEGDHWAEETYCHLATLDIGPCPEPLEHSGEINTVLYEGLSGYGHRGGQAFLFHFLHGPTILAIDCGHLEDALEAVAAALPKGYFTEPEYERSEECQDPACEAKEGPCGGFCNRCVEESEEDLTYTESGWLTSWEWSVQDVDRLAALRTAVNGASFGAYGLVLLGPEEQFWEVETVEGDQLFPVEDFGRYELADELGEDVESVRLSVAIHWRLSMAGYLDATDWYRAASWEDAFTEILETAESLQGAPQEEEI